MDNYSEHRTSPNFTVGEVGLFPPFFGRRIDYFGWLIGRRYHLWLAVGNSMIIVALGLEVFFVHKNILGLVLGPLFVLMYFIYNRIRRSIFLKNKKIYFRYDFQYLRALFGMFLVAALQVAFNKISGDLETPIWILYISVLLIASEYQHYSLQGYLGTGLLFLLTGLLQFLAGYFLLGSSNLELLFLEVFPSILAVWCISIGFLYLIQNIQKRSILFMEDNEYTRQLLKTRYQVADLDNFLKVCLEICVHRLRASHGSIWISHPSSGRLEFKTGLEYVEGKQETISLDKIDRISYQLDNPSDDIIYLAASNKKPIWCTVYDNNPLIGYSKGKPIKFNLENKLETIYQIAVPVLDKGEKGNVIGVINVNVQPGHIDNLTKKWPLLFGWFQKIAHFYILEWQKDLLQFTALQLSHIWEYSRLLYLFNILFGRLPNLYGDLRDSKVASLLADTLTEAVGTNSFVWCYRETRKEFILNGVGMTSEEKFNKAEPRNSLSDWLLSSGALDNLSIVPCPSELLKFTIFPNPLILLIPLKAKQGNVGVVGLLVRDSFKSESLHDEELSIIQAYVDQIAFAVGNERLRKITEEQAQALEIIQEITIESMKSKELDSYSDTVRELMEKRLGYQQVHVGIVRDASVIIFPTLNHVDHAPISLGSIHDTASTEIEKVWRNPQKPICLEDVKDGELPLGENWPNVKSAVLVPLGGGDGVYRGVLIVHDTKRRHAFTETDIHNITSLGSVLGICLEQIIQNMNLQVVAGIKDVKKVITLSLFTPELDFQDALVNLASNLYKNIFTDFDFLEIWRLESDTKQFVRVASSIEDDSLGLNSVTSVSSDLFTDAISEGVYCLDNITKGKYKSELKSAVWKETKAVCVVPLRAGSSNIGIMILCSRTEKEFRPEISFALEDIARNISEAWYLRENLEDFIRKTERLQILNQTHNIALSSSQYVLRGWARAQAMIEGQGIFINNPELKKVCTQLEVELKAVQTSIEIAVRGGRFAKIHELSLAGAIGDSVNAKRLLYEGEKDITIKIDEEVAAKISRKEAEELFFIFESAISNSIKNKAASKISISVEENNDGRFSLCIYDNGGGFDYDLARRDASHFGLRSMELSAQKIGWTLKVEKLEGASLICVIKSISSHRRKGPSP